MSFISKAADGTSPQAVHLKPRTLRQPSPTPPKSLHGCVQSASRSSSRIRLPQLIVLMRKLDLPIHPWLTQVVLARQSPRFPMPRRFMFPARRPRRLLRPAGPTARSFSRIGQPVPLPLPPISGTSKSLAVVPSAPSPAALRVMQKTGGSSVADEYPSQIDCHRRRHLRRRPSDVVCERLHNGRRRSRRDWRCPGAASSRLAAHRFRQAGIRTSRH